MTGKVPGIKPKSSSKKLHLLLLLDTLYILHSNKYWLCSILRWPTIINALCGTLSGKNTAVHCYLLDFAFCKFRKVKWLHPRHLTCVSKHFWEMADSLWVIVPLTIPIFLGWESSYCSLQSRQWGCRQTNALFTSSKGFFKIVLLLLKLHYFY